MPVKAIDPKAEALEGRLKEQATRQFADIFVRAYLEAGDDVREVITAMCRIIEDAKADADDRDAAMATLMEALFPSHGGDGYLGVDLVDIASREQDRAGYAAEAKRAQQATLEFSESLRRLMAERQVGQVELAKRVGVGQPAISMMLNRQCRPQAQTVKKLAKALGVSPEKLWPQT